MDNIINELEKKEEHDPNSVTVDMGNGVTCTMSISGNNNPNSVGIKSMGVTNPSTGVTYTLNADPNNK